MSRRKIKNKKKLNKVVPVGSMMQESKIKKVIKVTIKPIQVLSFRITSAYNCIKSAQETRRMLLQLNEDVKKCADELDLRDANRAIAKKHRKELKLLLASKQKDYLVWSR